MKTRSLLAILLVTVLTGSCKSPPTADKQWFRGNLHTHSLWSDGNDVPEMICDWYQKNGYQFLAISDHNTLADKERWLDVNTIIRKGGRTCVGRYTERFGKEWVEQREHEGKSQIRLKQFAEYRGLFERPGEFLLLQSEEVSSSFQKLPIHINVANIRERIPAQVGASVQEVIAAVLDKVQSQSIATGVPMLAHLNHPNFGYAITAEDLAGVLSEQFFEVWNGHPSIHYRGDAKHIGIERMWDVVNTLRITRYKSAPVFGLATDDSHQYFNLDPRQSITGRGWVMVRAGQLTPAALIGAMRAGDFYASSGVTLKTLRCSETAIELEVEPVGDERYVTQFIGTLASSGEPEASAIGQVLATVDGTRARYELTGKELYVRAVVISSAKPERPVYDDQLKRAWVQPVGWRARVPAAQGDGSR